LNAYEKVLDAFHGYDNTAGVFIGNEVLTTANSSQAAPYVKASARDIKAYRDLKGYRKIPVGYSAADIAALRPMLQNYLACSTNSADNVDFFALNAYEWCGDSSYTVSGYNMLQQNATDYPIPIFFSETGCNTNPPRDFMDQAAIFGPEMANTWSGAIVYEWLEEANSYGLISYGVYDSDDDPTNTQVIDGYTRQGTPTPISPDFFALKSRWATMTPSGVPLSEYTRSASTLTPPPCPASTPDGWTVDPSSTLPSVGQALVRETTTSSLSGTETAASMSAIQTGSAASRVTVMGPDNLDRVGKLITLLAGIAGIMCWWL
jgi:1,3-beta-glucanosyltransferase GAS1